MYIPIVKELEEQDSQVDHVLTGTFSEPVVIPEGQRWAIGGTVSVPSMIVDGILHMRPGSRLRLLGIDHSTFQGGDPADPTTDPGLYFRDNGIPDIEGTPKLTWGYVNDHPSWMPGDELIVASSSEDVLDIMARPFTRGSAIPTLDGFTVEVANLTRDVIIEAEPGREAHIIFDHSQRPFRMEYCELRHMGVPRLNDAGNNVGVLGRYALHCHHMGENSRGSLVRGVVARHSRNAVFWPHASHGITFEDCISFDAETFGHAAAFGWDVSASTDATDATRFVRCLDIQHRSRADFRFGATGVLFAAGLVPNNNFVIDCVVAGIQGQAFDWPEARIDDGLGEQRGDARWIFNGRAHHVAGAGGTVFGAGINVWQNRPRTDVLGDHHHVPLEVYRSRKGIRAGAYHNPQYEYGPGRIVGCGRGIELHVLPGEGTESIHSPPGYSTGFHDIELINNFVGVDIHRHNGIALEDPPVWFQNISFQGNNIDIRVDNGLGNPGRYDFIDCPGLSPGGVVIGSHGVVPGTRLRIQNASQAWEITWPNGVQSTRSISPFFVGGERVA